MGKHPFDPDLARDAELRRELGETTQALHSAYEKFNYVSEPEMVDACIYEISALKSRYSYLLRCIKGNAASAQQQAAASAETPCTAAAAMKGGELCQL